MKTEVQIFLEIRIEWMNESNEQKNVKPINEWIGKMRLTNSFICIAVSDILCTFSGMGDSKSRDSIAAKLRKPEGFRGSPLFADDRNADPLTDSSCQIRPDLTDATELTYNLLITDFSRCGVLKRNVSEFLSLLWSKNINNILKVPFSQLRDSSTYEFGSRNFQVLLWCRIKN